MPRLRERRESAQKFRTYNTQQDALESWRYRNCHILNVKKYADCLRVEAVHPRYGFLSAKGRTLYDAIRRLENQIDMMYE